MQSFTDETAPVLTDFDAPGDTLMISFGGFPVHVPVPRFEFVTITADIPVKKMFIRDLRVRFYQHGLPGIADDMDGIVRYVTQQIAGQQVRRVVMIGNSGGGYAALLFGALVPGIDEVHSFVPRTFFTFPARLILRPRFAWSHFQFLRGYARYVDERLDLEPLVRQRPSPTQFHIHYAQYNRADTGHAEWLQHLPNVNLYPYPYHQHMMIKDLRENGSLKKLLLKVLDPSPD